MEESVYKSELKKIKIKKRQMSTKLAGFMGEDVSILDSSMFDSHLKSIDSICHDVTDSIDELIIDLEDEDEEDARISDLDQMKNEILKILRESKSKLISNKSNTPGKDRDFEQKEEGEHSDQTDMAEHLTIIEKKALDSDNKLKMEALSKTATKKAVKAVMKEGTTVEELVLEIAADPTKAPKFVLEVVLGSIGEQLGVKGTRGFLSASLTHYAISQFAVLIGVGISPIKMDFSGITQAKILKKLEDLNKKVDRIISAPRREALGYLQEGLRDLSLNYIDFEEVRDKFKEVKSLAKKAISMDDDFTNFAVCTKYLLFAETMVQSFSKGSEDEDDCFLPLEKMSEKIKNKMASYLMNQVGDLKKKAETKAKKKDAHKEKVDDILKMVYNIISACENLSNPITLIDNDITFGVNTDFVPFGEEDATALQVGRYIGGKDVGDLEMKQTPAYTVYLWRNETELFVRRELKYFKIPLRQVQVQGQVNQNVVWIKLEGKDGKVDCRYGAKNEESFKMTSFPNNGYPENIQTMKDLFATAKSVKDMGQLPRHIYEQMQKISEIYLADLKININEKDSQENTLLHYVACLKPGWSSSFDPIECLVDSGADLESKDASGKTPLMCAMLKGKALESNIKALIHHCKGMPALNAVDNDGNNVLHLAVSMKESTFTKNIVQLLLDCNVNVTHTNNDEFNPKDLAHHRQNWELKKTLENWMKL